MGGWVRPVSAVLLRRVGERQVRDLRPGDWIEKAPYSGHWRKVLAVRQQPGHRPQEIALQAMGEGGDFLIFLLPEEAVQVARP